MKPNGKFLTKEEKLEAEADALLRLFPPNPEYPAYTEAHLLRKQIGMGATRCYLSLDSINEEFASEHPGLPHTDDLLSLASLTRLSPIERICIRAWVYGWTFCEIAENLDIGSRKKITTITRGALEKCLDMYDISFTRFCWKPLYHRPRRNPGAFLRRCRRCDEVYNAGLGIGSYCSTICKEAARRRQ